MKTVATAREEKNTQDARLDYQAKQEQERSIQMIQRIESKIEEEKKSIIECLDQSFFSMAKSKIERIQKMQEQIITLR